MWTHPLYDARAEDWQRCRDCYAGTGTIKAAGTTYLPRLSAAQSPESYEAYKAQAVFVNAFARSIGAYVGMVARVPPRVTAPDDLPVDDVTGDGTPLSVFAADLLREELTTGRVAVALDAIEGRVRWQRFRAEDVLTWQTEPGYRDRLRMVVLRESSYQPVERSEFELAERSTLYVWRATPDGVTVATMPEDGKATTVPAGTLALDARGAPLREIPVTIIGTGDVQVAPAKPPLMDMADVSLIRYIASAQYQRALFWGAVPQPYVTTDQPLPKDMTIGGGSIWKLPIGGSAGMVQTNGSGLVSMQSNLNDLTAQIANLGARLVTDTHTQPETAEAARIQSAGDSATLSGIVTGLDAGITRALRQHAEWSGMAGDVSYASNREFFDPKLDANELTSLLQTYQAGALSLDTLLARLADGGILPADTDTDDERERIARERKADGTESEANAG